MPLDLDLLDVIIEDASPKILQKAKGLLNRKRILEFKYDDDNKNLKAEVQSESYGGNYKVEINFLNDGFSQADCTCPYDWESTCKHIAAVALFAKQQVIAVQPAEPAKEITIRIAAPWVSNIYRHSPQTTFNYYHIRSENKIEITSLLNNGLILQLSNKAGSPKETIKIEKDIAELIITGYGIARKNKFSNNMWMALQLLDEAINGIRNLEEFMHEAHTVKHDVLDTMLKTYGDYIDEKSIEYVIQNGKPAIVIKDKSLILPPHIKQMNMAAANNIFADKLSYNPRLLPQTTPLDDLGYGFYMIWQPNTNNELAIGPMWGKWDKEHTGFKSGLTVIDLNDAFDIATINNDFLQLAISCRQLQRYNANYNNRSRNINTGGSSELYQSFVSTHQLLLGIIPQLSNYPFYVSVYSPSYNGQLRKSDTYRYNIESEPLRLHINCSDGRKYFECTPELLFKDEVFDIKDFEFVNSFFLKPVKGYILYYLSSAAETWLLLDLIEKKKLKTPLNLKNEFINSYLMPISKNVMVSYKGKPLAPSQNVTAAIRAKLYLSELGEFILFQPHVVYEPYELELFSEQEYIKDEAGRLIHISRQKDAEAELKNTFISLHPEFATQQSRGFLYLHHKEMLRNGWFMGLFEKLRQQNIEVLGFNKLTKLKYNPNKPSIQIKVGSGIDWFDIKIKVEFGNQAADLKEVRKAVLRKEQYVTLSDGSIGILPQEWIEKYSRYFGAGEVKKEGLQISKFQFTILDDFEDDLIDAKTLKELQIKRKRLREFEEIKEVKAPKGLKAKLRDYQQHGLAWLNFLDEFGWGGCLADDMGLGKTVQCIGFLLDQIKKYPDKQNLIIMPATLLFNWENELKKFAPSVKYHIHYGSERDEELLKQNDAHLILTSYGILVRDIEMLKEMNFNYVVLDESQAIKNSMSQRYKAVRQLVARNRIAMSGTPVENNTMELYSQMHFLNPGIFGSVEGFRKDYAGAIDKDNNVDAANRLRKIIKPFLIRRTKEQVAKELPGKTEMTLFCEMGDQQRKVYEAFKEKIRKELIEKIEQEGMNKARFAILDGLLKLRQICNSPALLNTTEDYGNDSIKADELIRSIREKTGEHKVLVFSQFLGMLDIIRKALEKENITYEYLDGQSKNRKDSVENFQNNESCRVFLISLKAGGTGLNLTAADYVYIVDPWWNPAVEDQAIDRTYRIGQDKKVFAYRMICHNTIEEKIITLQEKKKGLVKDIIGVEEGFIKALSKEDVMSLLV